MKIYACRELEYERIKLKRAKAASRQGKNKRGHSAERPSLAEYSNTSLILDMFDEMEDSIQRNSKCCKRLHQLDTALAATFKCTICLHVTNPEGIVYAGCCDRLVVCTECADEWYTRVPFAGTRKAAARGNGRVAFKPLSILSKIETFSFPWFDLLSLVSFQFSTEQVLTL